MGTSTICFGASSLFYQSFLLHLPVHSSINEFRLWETQEGQWKITAYLKRTWSSDCVLSLPFGINLDLYSNTAFNLGCTFDLPGTSEAYLFRPRSDSISNKPLQNKPPSSQKAIIVPSALPEWTVQGMMWRIINSLEVTRVEGWDTTNPKLLLLPRSPVWFSSCPLYLAFLKFCSTFVICGFTFFSLTNIFLLVGIFLSKQFILSYRLMDSYTGVPVDHPREGREGNCRGWWDEVSQFLCVSCIEGICRTDCFR